MKLNHIDAQTQEIITKNRKRESRKTTMTSIKKYLIAIEDTPKFPCSIC